MSGLMSIISLVGSLMTSAFPMIGQAERDAFLLKLQAQIDVTKLAEMQVTADAVEANSPSFFIAGWRPAFGWLGVIAIGYNTIFIPAIKFAGTMLVWLGANQQFMAHSLSLLPNVDMSLLGTIVLQMLGMAGLRSWEKVNSVARDKL